MAKKPLPSVATLPSPAKHHTTDSLLRDHGFKIEARPRSGEPVWSLRGRKYLQKRALELVEAGAV